LSNCIKCKPGQFLDGITCKNCSNGRYSVNGSASSCVTCPYGYFANSSGSTSCSRCPIGYYSPDGAACSSCAGGYFKKNASLCLECLPGFFSTGSDSPSCLSCPVGKFSNFSSPECSNCPYGTWSNSIAVTSISECHVCSRNLGMVCPEGCSIPHVDSGFFRTLDNPGRVQPCYPSEACASTENTNTSCLPQYVGIRCSNCKDDYFRSAGRCVKCLNPTARWIIIVCTMVVLLFIISKLSERQRSIPTSLRMMLFWLQFLSLYPSLSSFWPPVLERFLNFTSMFNLDLGYLGIGCDLRSSSYFLLLQSKILLPVVFTFFLVAKNFFSEHFFRGNKLSHSQVFSHSVFLINFFSIQLLSSMLQVFNCFSVGTGEKYISQEPSIQCGQAAWYQFILFDVFFIVFYLIMIPSLLVYFFIRAKRTNDSEIIATLIQPLTQNYKEGCEWFEIAKMLFRLCFVLIRDTFQLASGTKIVFLGLLLFIMFWIESLIQPYVEQVQQDLSSL
jgi:hypothetical protein